MNALPLHEKMVLLELGLSVHCEVL
jgi:hypothetical protein